VVRFDFEFIKDGFLSLFEILKGFGVSFVVAEILKAIFIEIEDHSLCFFD
jgi:hypothetical protein